MMELKTSNRQEAYEKFAFWVETNEKKLNSACHCCPQTKSQTATNGTPCQKENGCIREPNIIEEEIVTPVSVLPNGHQKTHSWRNVISYHQNVQTEVEDYGKQLNYELKQHLSEDKTSTEKDWSEFKDLEERWHKLWLKSLEQLVVVERARRCPKHNSTIIGKPAPTGDKSIARPQRRRPVSYPNNYSDRLEWDYNHTLSLTGCHKENGSQIDLDSVDEQVTKNLTEFGENYELWFAKDDDISLVPIQSRPPSVEPAEKPEFAKAIVTSTPKTHEDVNPNLLMLTTPSGMLSVDFNRYPRKRSTFRMFTFPVLLAIVLLIISAVYHEPHILHRTYYHKYPPV